MTDSERPTSPSSEASSSASDPIEALRSLLLELEAPLERNTSDRQRGKTVRATPVDRSPNVRSNPHESNKSSPARSQPIDRSAPPQPPVPSTSEIAEPQRPKPKPPPTPQLARRETPPPPPEMLPLPANDARLARIEHQMQEMEGRLDRATESMSPLMPLVKEILASLSPIELRKEVVNALVPAIDRVIRERAKQNPHAMNRALAEILPGAIGEEILNNPEQIANAIAPEMAIALRRQIEIDRDAIRDALASEMGRFIKAQIELEREAMVDALYPVIGNTIAKYMGEAVREINSKVENALSFEGVRRKIRAKMQGVSEAELILREALPFRVKAAFLIHKGSGLVICEAQISEEERLESDMIAGMLTAIRSFAADCIAQPGNVSELNQIEYDTFDITMEVAGYCYLTIVSEGPIPKSFIEQFRKTLGYIVQKYGDPIEQYDGDPETVPEAVGNRVQMLVEAANAFQSEESSKHPPFLLIFLVLLLLGFLGWGARTWWVGRWAARAQTALRSTPELAVYRLDADVKRNALVLSGEVPTPNLRDRAETVVREVLPERRIDNRILTVDVSPDADLVKAEIDRTVEALNAIDGIELQAFYENGRVSLLGELPDAAIAQQVAQNLEGIPGVRTVVSTVRIPNSPLETRLYFPQGSAAVSQEMRAEKLQPLAAFLLEFPQLQVTAIGHTDMTGAPQANEKLSRERADAAKAALVELGVPPERVRSVGSLEPPPDIDAVQSPQLSRCVRFEIVSEDAAAESN
ncbi:MAG: OmpA family protein [Cyanobacteria bacterium SID2]|nr:OmpA family protein [Cyanobacteria bacterium SID2]